MTLVPCPECQAQVSDKATACPHCGCPLHATEPAPAEPTPATPARIYEYACPLCGEGFDTGSDLYHHRKTAHRGGWIYNKSMVCPHCHVQGQVATRQVEAKKGISGGKATGAVLTGGLSILATGLSRKEMVTEASCYNCKARWTF